MVRLIRHKSITILSDGSVNLSATHFYTPKQLIVNEKDNKNFSLNKKQVTNKIQSEAFSSN